MKVYRDPLLKMEKNPGGDCLTVTGKGDNPSHALHQILNQKKNLAILRLPWPFWGPVSKWIHVTRTNPRRCHRDLLWHGFFFKVTAAESPGDLKLHPLPKIMVLKLIPT